jgi:hypothetical protein
MPTIRDTWLRALNSHECSITCLSKIGAVSSEVMVDSACILGAELTVGGGISQLGGRF